MHFFVISIKKYFFTIIFLLFTISLVLFSKTNLVAAQNGLLLWATSIVPSLLPFFIATELLFQTNFVTKLGKFFHNLMKPIFNVPGESAIAIIMGIISGYPIGAKIVCDLYEKKICSKPEAERLIAFTNNSGPMFILATVGISFFGNPHIGHILLITHILSALLVGIIFRFWKKNNIDINYRTYHSSKTDLIKVSNLGEILGTAITKSISSILMIGGFVVLFSVIISILNTSNILSAISYLLEVFRIPHDFSISFISGLIEMTNGLQLTSNLYSTFGNLSVFLASFLIGFGGLSIMLQVFSIISKYGISIKPYLYGKFLQSIISIILISIFI